MNRQELIEELKRLAALVDALIGKLRDKEDVGQRCLNGLEKCKGAGKLSENNYSFYKNEIEQAMEKNDTSYLEKTLRHLTSIFKGEVV